MGQTHWVRTSDDLTLHVREWGNPDGRPILFIHGWSASHLAWSRQDDQQLTDDFRLVALDLRGHGMSDAPLDAHYYTDGQRWADDIAAIIEQIRLDRPVLVGWSYGGLVISDYARVYGESAIAGVNFVGAAVVLHESVFGTLIGPGFLDYVEGATQPDLSTNIHTLREFLRRMPASPLSQEEYEVALAFIVLVPHEVRRSLLAREVESDDVLKRMSVPELISHGHEDQVILPAMAEHVLDICPHATGSWYEGVGHMPFLERPERFNRELAAFARQCAAA